ncbi:sodium:solute symporter family protein [Abyssisolibacter fermentans]|uniref:sodium:solute symporter family protein n=1 Tax=Abyssisolibacter fermentans TaxID=1766203 RepID=UPI0008378E28|nr:sodium:solute symporter family protein [Abyssisolibacter fermentans]
MILTVFYITIFITLIAGYLSKRLVKNSKDFLIGGGRLGTTGTLSMLMGAIIGGASTVGTSQMAYERGIGAVWFTLGLSVSSILLYVFYGKLLEKKEYITVTQIIGNNIGQRAKKVASIVLCLGMFIHINGQVLASVSIFNSLLNFKIYISSLIVCVLITCYVIFGGFWGGTIVGGIKTILLYSTSIICGLYLICSYDFISASLDTFTYEPWFNIFSNGFIKDLSLPISTILGVLSTQIYFQTIMAAKDKKVLKKSCIITSFLILPVGIVCTMIGMFMRMNYPNIIARDAFILFVKNHTNPIVAGLSIASVLISSIATGAGLTLGITTILSKDVLHFPKTDKDSSNIKKLRFIIIAIISIIYFIVIANENSLILGWGFLSMIFRATPVFVPVLISLYCKKYIIRKYEILHIIIGPVFSILWILFGFDKISSIYIGILSSLLFAHIMYKFKNSSDIM